MVPKDQLASAKGYGFSFDSKKVAMGPAFLNMRLMCVCLGRAIRRHLDFNPDNCNFLDEKKKSKQGLVISSPKVDLTDSSGSVPSAFSYNLKEQLKIKDMKGIAEEEYDEDFERSIGQTSISPKMFEVPKDIQPKRKSEAFQLPPINQAKPSSPK